MTDTGTPSHKRCAKSGKKELLTTACAPVGKNVVVCVFLGLSGAAERALLWYFNVFCRLNHLAVSTPPAAPGSHPCRPASFKAYRASHPCARVSRAAFSRARGLQARSAANGGYPATVRTSTRHRSPSGQICVVWSPERRPSAPACLSKPRSLYSGSGTASEVQGRRWYPPLLAATCTSIPRGPPIASLSPSGPIRVVHSPERCPSACPSELRSLKFGPGAASEVQGRWWYSLFFYF